MEPKIIAMYLPQYHEIPENNEFWGKGFSDWVTVKKAKPLFKGHDQPKVPLNGNYYDLSQKESVKWQAELAKKYGVYGFGIYHYWFNNDKNLLTKPAEIIKDNPDIDIKFHFAWDNTSWVRSWSNVSGNAWAPSYEKSKLKGGKAVLVEYILGSKEDWKKHYEWLRPFFKDERYIKKNNKPIFVIFHFSPEIEQMCNYWQKLAQNDGFAGIHFIFRYVEDVVLPKGLFSFRYEPIYSGWSNQSLLTRIINKIGKIIRRDGTLNRYIYKSIWKNIISNAKKTKDSSMYYGAFVSYDDTPRRGRKGIVVVGSTPSIFRDYLGKLVKICKIQNKEFIFLTAWNEWGEGAYLEPDESNQQGFLEALNSL